MSSVRRVESWDSKKVNKVRYIYSNKRNSQNNDALQKY